MLQPRLQSAYPVARCMLSFSRSFAGSASTASPAASAVDQMIEFAHTQRQVNPNMAVDVLMSGLSYSSSDPLGTARLHIAIAQIEADRNNWDRAHTHANSGMLLATPAVPEAVASELAIQAGGLATQALLISGRDEDALALAAQCEQALRPVGHAAALELSQVQPQASCTSPSASTASPHVRSVGLLALAAHAAGTAAGQGSMSPSSAANAGGNGGGGVAGEPPGSGLPSAGAALKWLAAELGRDGADVVRRDPGLADAASALGLLRLAARDHEEAADSMLAAAAEAAAAARARNGTAASSSPSGAAGASTSWPQLQHHAEVEADALTGRAQLQMRRLEWGAAEELLGSALKAAEAAHGERSASLAPLLTLLGYTYSRSARVTFAEGLFREAAKLMRLDPARYGPGPPPAPQGQRQEHEGQQGEDDQLQLQAQEQQQRVRSASAAAGVHASTGAVLAWRYAQLLWVLPNRGGEAERWEGCARQFWASCGGLGTRDIEAVLGDREHLKGQGPSGSGVMFSVRFRRAWRCAQPRR